MYKDLKISNLRLDESQMELINCNSNALVIAGAGSGKTTTILAKIAHLIDCKICKPEEILVLSFTNACVDNIRAKTSKNVTVLTFHGLAISILKKAQINYSIVTNYSLQYICKEYLKTINKHERKTILRFLRYPFSYKKFTHSNEFEEFINLIMTFINLFKSNSFTKEYILAIHYNRLEKKILNIIFNIYYLYLSEKYSTNKLDLDDLIIYATKSVKNINLNYKYIIVDEFQDTSLIRLNLIKEVYNNTNSKIIVVGDDWQSIYRFSGCDINIFLNFSKYFPNIHLIKLNKTYRTSQKLNDISSKFILKNKLQIPKELISNKESNSPIAFFPYKYKKSGFKSALDEVLKLSDNIMVLSRNSFDIYSYIDNDFSLSNDNLTYKNRLIKYYTVHKSKGLESDYVIILNCNDEYYGFPNNFNNSPIIQKLIPNNEIKFAEERRLFYVALTRGKIKTYLLYNKNYPSIFIKELKRIYKKTKN